MDRWPLGLMYEFLNEAGANQLVRVSGSLDAVPCVCHVGADALGPDLSIVHVDGGHDRRAYNGWANAQRKI